MPSKGYEQLVLLVCLDSIYIKDYYISFAFIDDG